MAHQKHQAGLLVAHRTKLQNRGWKFTNKDEFNKFKQVYC